MEAALRHFWRGPGKTAPLAPYKNHHWLLGNFYHSQSYFELIKNTLNLLKMCIYLSPIHKSFRLVWQPTRNCSLGKDKRNRYHQIQEHLINQKQ